MNNINLILTEKNLNKKVRNFKSPFLNFFSYFKKYFFLNCLIGSFLSIFLLPISIVEAVDIKNGESIFNANCSACHAGGNNVIVNEKTLKKDVLKTNGMDSVDAIVYQVTNGKNAMPAFGGRLTDMDMEDAANYVLMQAEKEWR